MNEVFWVLPLGQEQAIDINAPDNDPGHMDLPELIKSRKKVLEMGDWVIPGHGKVFNVKNF